MGNFQFARAGKPDQPCSHWTDVLYTAALEDDLGKLNEAASKGADINYRKSFIDKKKKYKNIDLVSETPSPYSFLEGRRTPGQRLY